MKKKEVRKIKTLFKKHKGLIKDKFETSDFKEPVLLLMRRNNKCEFFESASSGNYDFEHSDGTSRTVMLNPKNLLTFPYGNRSFRGYICHEDSPMALPEDPLVISELFNIAIAKTLHDNIKWQEKVIKAKGDLIWKVALGVVVIIIAIALYKMMVPPSSTTQVVETVKTTVQYVNASNPQILG